MSMKSWQQEFYPVEPSKKFSKRKALEHSILKWTGLLKKNLKRHGVEKNDNSIGDGKFKLLIASNSCALCEKYLIDYSCTDCPLYEHLGHRCDSLFFSKSPYNVWCNTGNALPMLRALKASLRELEEK